MTARTYQFARLTMDISKRCVVVDGDAPLTLTGKEYEILYALVRKSGTVVSKEDLMAEVWRGVSVSENTLHQHIRALRRKIEQATGEQPIQTVTGQGYYLPRVREETATDAGREAQTAASTSGLGLARTRRRVLVGTLALAGALLSGVAILQLGPKRDTPRPSLAIWTFQNLSGARDAAWLAGALPEMFRTEIALGDRFRLVSAGDTNQMRAELTSADAVMLSQQTAVHIRTVLGADYLLAGSYAVLHGDQLRLDVTVLDTSSGQIVAAESGTAGEASLFALVTHLGVMLRQKLGANPVSVQEAQSGRRAWPANPEAARLYTAGLEYLRVFDGTAAVRSLEQAAALEPDSASVLSALAEAQAALGYETRAKEISSRAARAASGLPQTERLQIEARNFELQRDWRRAARTYQALWVFFPDTPDFGFKLAAAQAEEGRTDDALRTLRELRSASRKDPRIDLVEARTHELAGDFARELAAATRAIEHSESLGAKLMAARGRLAACWALDQLGRHEEAIRMAEAAGEEFARLGDRGREARALKDLADALGNSGRTEEALRTYERAFQIFRDIGSESGMAVVHLNQGFTLLQQGNYGPAMAALNRSLKISLDIGHDRFAGLSQNGLGIVSRREGDTRNARKYFEEAYRFFLEAGDRARAGTTLGNVAITMMDQGLFAEARTKYEQSLGLIKQTGNVTEMARTLGNIGILLMLEGRLTEAGQRIYEDLRISEQIDNPYWRAEAQHLLGNLLFMTADFPGARKAYEESLALREPLGQPGEMAETRLLMAELELEEQRAAAADALVRQAIEEFERDGQSDLEAQGRAMRAGCLILLGRPNDARTASKRAAEIVPEIQDLPLKLQVQVLLARSYRHLGELGAASTVASTVMTEANRVGLPAIAMEAEIELTKTRIASGRAAPNALQSLLERCDSLGYAWLARRLGAAAERADGRGRSPGGNNSSGYGIKSHPES